MIEIYTDGACSGNPGPGGWATIILGVQPIQVEVTGGARQTTNNRMEMQAVIEGLRFLGDARQEVTLYSDSAYVCDCINNGWYKNWRVNGWKTSSKKPVLNQDLWQTILDLNDHHKIKFIRVKGHANNALNNRCDELAVAEVNNYR